MICQGHFVAFVCSNPSGYDIFYLEKKGHKVMDKENIGPSITEAIFHLVPGNESTAGIYCCIYKEEPNWSLHSETLELKVTSEDVTKSPNPGSAETPGLFLRLWTLTLATIPFLISYVFLSPKPYFLTSLSKGTLCPYAPGHWKFRFSRHKE